MSKIIRSAVDPTSQSRSAFLDKMCAELLAGTRNSVSCSFAGPLSGLTKVADNTYDLDISSDSRVRIFSDRAFELLGSGKNVLPSGAVSGSVAATAYTNHQIVIAYNDDAFLMLSAAGGASVTETYMLGFKKSPRNDGIVVSRFAMTAFGVGGTVSVTPGLVRTYPSSGGIAVTDTAGKQPVVIETSQSANTVWDPAVGGNVRCSTVAYGYNPYGDRTTAGNSIVVTFGSSNVMGDTLTDGVDVWDYVFTSQNTGNPALWLRR